MLLKRQMLGWFVLRHSRCSSIDETDEHDEVYEANETDKDDEADEDNEAERRSSSITINQHFARTLHSAWQNRQAKHLDRWNMARKTAALRMATV